MADLLDRGQMHIFLEKMYNKNNSFIANVNKLADKVNDILLANELFNEDVIPLLQELDTLNLNYILDDLKKGTYLGNRQIDINLLYNMQDYTETMTDEEATTLWTNPAKYVYYDSATALFTDGTSYTINFTLDENPATIVTHADLLLQLNGDAGFLTKLNSTSITSFPIKVVGEYLKFYDIVGGSSNIERITLHVASGSAKEVSVPYYWEKSTSSLEALAARVNDIIELGRNIDEIIVIAHNRDQFSALYNVLPELIEVHDNILPVLEIVLQAGPNAQVAQNYAFEAGTSAIQAVNAAQTAQALSDSMHNLTVGNTTTAVAGTPANVSYDSSQNQLNFIIPTGPKGDKGDAFTVNAIGTLANRSNYDAQTANFSYFATDNGMLYFKQSDTSGDWTDGIPFGKGDKGDNGETGNGIASVTFTSTTDASGQPAQYGATDTYTITYTDTTTTTFNVKNGEEFVLTPSTSEVYVSKQGSDLNSGLTIQDAKFTINAAITVAQTLLNNTPRVTIEVLDGSTYSEDIILPANIALVGVNASLEGTLTLNNGCLFEMYGHYARVNGTVMVSKLGNAHSYYKTIVCDGTGILGTLTGVTNIQHNVTGSVLFIEASLMKTNYKGISESTASGIGHVHVNIEDIYLLGNNAIGIDVTGINSSIVGYVNHLLLSGTPTNTIGINIIASATNALVNLTINKLLTAVPYKVLAGVLSLMCLDIQDSEAVIVTAPGKVNLTSDSKGGDIPIFTPSVWFFNTPAIGHLFCDVDNGVLTEGAFPDVYAQLVLLATPSSDGIRPADSNIRTMSEYAAAMVANGGICSFFALDVATRTFRIPCMPGVYWRSVSQVLGLTLGMYQKDQIRPITGTGFNTISVTTAVSGAMVRVATPNTNVSGSLTAGVAALGINTALLGDNYNGTDTHPMSVVVRYQMKMYGAVTEASETNITALIAATTGKLDTNQYVADTFGRPFALGEIIASGPSISGSTNVVSVSRPSTGVYIVTLTSGLSDTNYKVLASLTAISAQAAGITYNKNSATQITFYTANGSNVASNAYGFSFAIYP